MKTFILVLTSFILSFGLVSCSDFDPERDSKLLREVCDLPSPPKAVELDKSEIIRSHAGVITKHYSSESECPSTENYYKTVLKERGWEKVPYSYFRNHGLIEFKKGDLTITLECSQPRSSQRLKKFHVDCSKGLR